MPTAAPRHREAPKPFSIAALVRSRLRDASLNISPDEGAAEQRISEAIQARLPERLRGPAGALALPYAAGQTTSTIGGGGALSPNLADLGAVLRPELALERLGARRVELPDGMASRSTATTSKITSSWINPSTGENPPVAEFTVGSSTAHPRELVTELDVSRLLLKVTPRAEALLRELFAAATEQAHEQATIAGSGSNGQPMGLVVAGEAGVLQQQPTAGSLPTFDELAGGLQLALDSGAHVRRSAFLLPTADHDELLLLERRPGIPALVERPDGGWSLAGRPCEFSPFLPSGKAIAGEFAEVEVVYQGAPNLQINPYTKTHQGITRLSIFDYMDSVVRRPQLLTLIG
jgi:HK97 family phage major capsid protein